MSFVGKPKVIVKKRSDIPVEMMEDKPDRKPIRDTKLLFLDQLAESTVCLMGYKWANADSDFPLEPYMRTVRYCYPYAKDGLLLIDEPTSKGEEDRCKRKQKCLQERGIRYLILNRNMSLVDCMMELNKCLGQPQEQN